MNDDGILVFLCALPIVLAIVTVGVFVEAFVRERMSFEDVGMALGKTLIVFIGIVLAIVLWPVMPALSLTDVVLLLILMEMRSQGAKS